MFKQALASIMPVKGPSPFERDLMEHPKVFLDGQSRLAISWSAKSACTRVLMWYLYHMGCLEEARSYNSWLHVYRKEVLAQSTLYLSARQKLIKEGARHWTYVKVVRDPVARCISSYRHAISTGYADQGMSETLGLPISSREGFSLETFLSFLSNIDLSTANLHHRVQAHSLDGSRWSQIRLIHINDQDLTESLSEIDRAFGLPVAFESDVLKEQSSHDEQRYQSPDGSMREAPTDGLWKQPLGQSMLANWPAQSELAVPEVVEQIRCLYQRDYEMIEDLKRKSV